MMRYLYAIVERADSALPPVCGMGDAELSLVPYGQIAAVVSRIESARLAPTPELVWRHEQVIEALMADRALLPMRFGSIAPDRPAIEAALAQHHDAFAADIARIGRRVELGLRVLCEGAALVPAQRLPEQLAAPAADPGARSGRSYLLARLAQERQASDRRQAASALAESIHACVAGLAGECSYRALPTERMLMAGAYLVEREQIGDFQQAVASLSAAYPQLQFLGTGPWPPYHFVTAGAARRDDPLALLAEAINGT